MSRPTNPVRFRMNTKVSFLDVAHRSTTLGQQNASRGCSSNNRLFQPGGPTEKKSKTHGSHDAALNDDLGP